MLILRSNLKPTVDAELVTKAKPLREKTAVKRFEVQQPGEMGSLAMWTVMKDNWVEKYDGRFSSPSTAQFAMRSLKHTFQITESMIILTSVSAGFRVHIALPPHSW